MRIRPISIGAAALTAFAASALLLTGAAPPRPKDAKNPPNVPSSVTNELRDQSVRKGLAWLVSVQGKDGGWGQDGGETSYVRQGERLETSGNDVANTAVAMLALSRSGSTPAAGQYRDASRRGLEFILRNVEASNEEGLAVTGLQGTQIQRKLGPHIDTFLTSMLLSELDGTLGDAQLNRRVRVSLQKVVRKIEKNQLADGSWNISGGWAPILGTSIASRSLDNARQKGVRVNEQVVARVDKYTKDAQSASGATGGSGIGSGRGRGDFGVASAASPVAVYADAQALEQLSRTETDRRANASTIRSIQNKLRDQAYVDGFGSMGGEEFFSYLNISESLRRAGGAPWTEWNGNIRKKLVGLQNNDGTWVGHHCITGRVAVTGAAVLTLMADQNNFATGTGR